MKCLHSNNSALKFQINYFPFKLSFKSLASGIEIWNYTSSGQSNHFDGKCFEYSVLSDAFKLNRQSTNVIPCEMWNCETNFGVSMESNYLLYIRTSVWHPVG